MLKQMMAIVAAVLVTACATETRRPAVDPGLVNGEIEKQKALAKQEWRDMAARLDRVAKRVLESGGPICEMPCPQMVTPMMLESPAVNAWANNDRVYVTRAMMRFLDNDDELAIVVGHEAAHIIKHHARRKVVPTAITTLLQLALPIVDVTDRMKDELAGTKDMEEEADYVGLYLAARAGFDLEKGVNAWRKMGTYDPRMIELARSHPLPAQRYVTMEAAIAEIKAKQAKGEPLVPNMKE